MAQVRELSQTFEELIKWLRDEYDLVEYTDSGRCLVFPNKVAEIRLEQFGKGLHRPYKFYVGDEELFCAYPRKMNQYLLAWWAGFSISMEVNQ
jgi:hypothetical protein